MRLLITIAFFIFLVLIALAFGIQNQQTVTLSFLIAKADITVTQAVSIFTGIGLVMGFVLSSLFRLIVTIRKKRQAAAKKASI